MNPFNNSPRNYQNSAPFEECVPPFLPNEHQSPSVNYVNPFSNNVNPSVNYVNPFTNNNPTVNSVNPFTNNVNPSVNYVNPFSNNVNPSVSVNQMNDRLNLNTNSNQLPDLSTIVDNETLSRLKDIINHMNGPFSDIYESLHSLLVSWYEAVIGHSLQKKDKPFFFIEALKVLYEDCKDNEKEAKKIQQLIREIKEKNESVEADQAVLEDELSELRESIQNLDKNISDYESKKKILLDEKDELQKKKQSLINESKCVCQNCHKPFEDNNGICNACIKNDKSDMDFYNEHWYCEQCNEYYLLSQKACPNNHIQNSINPLDKIDDMSQYIDKCDICSEKEADHVCITDGVVMCYDCFKDNGYDMSTVVKINYP